MKRLILLRIVTPLTSEVIIVTMHALLYTIMASAHTHFVFSSLTSVQFSHIQLSCRSLNFWFGLYIGSV